MVLLNVANQLDLYSLTPIIPYDTCLIVSEDENESIKENENENENENETVITKEKDTMGTSTSTSTKRCNKRKFGVDDENEQEQEKRKRQSTVISKIVKFTKSFNVATTSITTTPTTVKKGIIDIKTSHHTCSFNVHKERLCHYSEYFAAMFRNKMSENLEYLSHQSRKEVEEEGKDKNTNTNTNTNTILLQEIKMILPIHTKKYMETILHFIYNGFINFDIKNGSEIVHLWRLGVDFFQISALKWALINNVKEILLEKNSGKLFSDIIMTCYEFNCLSFQNDIIKDASPLIDYFKMDEITIDTVDQILEPWMDTFTDDEFDLIPILLIIVKDMKQGENRIRLLALIAQSIGRKWIENMDAFISHLKMEEFIFILLLADPKYRTEKLLCDIILDYLKKNPSAKEYKKIFMNLVDLSLLTENYFHDKLSKTIYSEAEMDIILGMINGDQIYDEGDYNIEHDIICPLTHTRAILHDFHILSCGHVVSRDGFEHLVSKYDIEEDPKTKMCPYYDECEFKGDNYMREHYKAYRRPTEGHQFLEQYVLRDLQVKMFCIERTKKRNYYEKKYIRRIEKVLRWLHKNDNYVYDWPFPNVNDFMYYPFW